jgi:hypothetical protein
MAAPIQRYYEKHSKDVTILWYEKKNKFPKM